MSAARLTTREFSIDDYAQACALWNEVEGVEICEGDSRAEILAFLARNPGLSRVAEEDGQLAGAVLCGHDGRRGYIYHLAVAPRARRLGAGRLLIEECMTGLRAAGIKRALLLAADDNSLGQEFWLRNGWEKLEAIAMGRDIER
ncbi:MAG: GNAT family N-acetyltransferase [Verrucomicrobiota bacterium]|nr:GNAT family N-acetyltransferase [Verrucomicrobiota bacterium]